MIQVYQYGSCVFAEKSIKDFISKRAQALADTKPTIYWASNDVLSTFYAQSRKGLYRWLAKVRGERNV
jgi:hypothetical protein